MNGTVETVGNTATAARADRLRITEIFLSLQGESRTSGLPTVFVRLTGCPLRCTYCDTAYAFHGGEWKSFADILATVEEYGVRHVCVTGGEPLAQPGCIDLLRQLCDAGYAVSLETSGALPIEQVDPRVMKILDLKTPASGEVERNRWENLEFLSADDQVKLVICNREDYDWASEQIRQRRLNDYCEVLLSPSWGQMDVTQLADWIVEDRLPARLQVQLHKILWGDKPGV